MTEPRMTCPNIVGTSMAMSATVTIASTAAATPIGFCRPASAKAEALNKRATARSCPK